MFYDTLLEVLKTDERFVAEDGSLLRNRVYQEAMKMDEHLIEMLLETPETKARFFKEVKGVLVFDKTSFAWAINSKQFLPDSYTRFEKKIGLADSDGNFLTTSGEVELVFPYKDCVLEGGQTKEEQKRNEIFYNETLAPNEIDRLLEPKVFIGAKRYTKEGAKSTADFTAADNLVVKGNNLLVLGSLLRRYEGKINLIYIDPPFNTGKDSFNYNDKFSRSSWLTFMKNRLVLAKKLLTRDGNIFIHIDINQSHYLKVLSDEIFDEDNFVEEIIWAYGSPSGGRSSSPKPVNIHDYILHYSMNFSSRKQNRVHTPYSEEYIKKWFRYKDADGRIYQRRQRGKDENGDAIWEKQYLDESEGVPLSTVWSDIRQVYADPRAYKAGNTADVEVIKEFTGGQKPEALLRRILEMASDEGDTVLDFNLGTGTTAAVAHKMNRRYIGVEQMDSQITIILKRLQDVIAGETAGISKKVGWQGGGSFVYCELAKQNQNFVEEIEAAADADTLQEIYKRMLASGFISHKVKPSSIDAAADDYEAFSLYNKKRFLMEILDKNLLYVNYCDIDDQEFKISDADKAFTKSFYKEG